MLIVKENIIFKPKSEDELENVMSNMPPGKLLILGAIHNIVPVIEKGLNGLQKGDLITPSEALVEASKKGNLEAVEFLLKDPRVDPSNSGKQLTLWAAAENGQDKIVNRLLKDQRVDPAYEDSAALIIAVEKLQVPVIKEFLDDGRVDVEEAKKIVHKMLETVEFLTEKRGKLVKIRDWFNVYKKISESSIENVLRSKSFNEFKEELDKMSPDGIVKRGMKNNIEDIVIYGIDEGAEPDLEMLIWAISKYKIKTLERLLKEEIDDALIDEAIDTAVIDGNMKAFELLTEKRKDFIPTKKLLHTAILQEHPDILKKLLEYPELDPSEDSNLTMSLALHSRNEDIIKLLLNDPRIKAKLSPQQTEKYNKKYNAIVKEELCIT